MDAMLFTEAAAMNIPGVDNVAVTRIDRGRLGTRRATITLMGTRSSLVTRWHHQWHS